MLGSYTAENVASQLGMAEFYFNDVNVAFKEVAYYKAVTMEDIKRVAAEYFSLDKVRVINMLPPQ
jgi:predicted Zn-dependent peptidase